MLVMGFRTTLVLLLMVAGLGGFLNRKNDGLPGVHQGAPRGVGTSPSLRPYLLDHLSGERHFQPHPDVMMVVDSFVDTAEKAASLAQDLWAQV